MDALKKTLESANRFQPLGRNSVLTHYDVEDFFSILEDNLEQNFERPASCVIQSYSNIYVKKSSGISILFFKDLTNVSSKRKNALFEKYSKSKFAKETGWDELMIIYHKYSEKSD
jgi:hypothetical protein